MKRCKSLFALALAGLIVGCGSMPSLPGMSANDEPEATESGLGREAGNTIGQEIADDNPYLGGELGGVVGSGIERSMSRKPKPAPQPTPGTHPDAKPAAARS